MMIPKINKQVLKESAPMKTFSKIVNSNAFVSFFAKGILLIITWIVALIPVWFYLLVRWLIDPIGFWQEMAMFVVAAIVIGWVQIILGIFAAVFTFIVLFEDI